MDKDLSHINGGPRALNLAKPPLKRGLQGYHDSCDYPVKLARIEAALRRMDEGRFGFCLGCTAEIKLMRLSEDPTTAFCEDCE